MGKNIVTWSCLGLANANSGKSGKSVKDRGHVHSYTWMHWVFSGTENNCSKNGFKLVQFCALKTWCSLTIPLKHPPSINWCQSLGVPNVKKKNSRCIFNGEKKELIEWIVCEAAGWLILMQGSYLAKKVSLCKYLFHMHKRKNKTSMEMLQRKDVNRHRRHLPVR